MSDFDRERFDELAAKAERNELEPEDLDEFREQLDGLKDLLTDVATSLIEIMEMHPAVKLAKSLDLDNED